MTVRSTVGKSPLIYKIAPDFLADTFVPGVLVSGRFRSVIYSLLYTQNVQLNMESSLRYLLLNCCYKYSFQMFRVYLKQSAKNLLKADILQFIHLDIRQ